MDARFIIHSLFYIEIMFKMSLRPCLHIKCQTQIVEKVLDFMEIDTDIMKSHTISPPYLGFHAIKTPT
jgi:hypothetical protein